jgi:hypothetical protein
MKISPEFSGEIFCVLLSYLTCNFKCRLRIFKLKMEPVNFMQPSFCIFLCILGRLDNNVWQFG